ncbi:hypothetical protein FEM48_Zijuj01G0272900 [Ziziphus jujuba var. spinosa]|uniref:DUF4220 domain-containing protein n=1 Tax=Ziziphus jujuba var. spinosa TaxID=714518 RepID=A0A978W582_ZIZJJ|nr:hypothetical protein FEM48_Zijuj01G0272900 [Ziziphus jujuba var. spinosa]
MLVLTSMVLQLILVRYGYRKNHRATSRIQIVVWIAYFLADWVATVSINHLLNRINKFIPSSPRPDTILDLEFKVRAFWCPFLLLHLGGPDTITSYSLVDNELWLRHMAGVVIQLGFAFYLYIRFFFLYISIWEDPLPYVAIPVFVAGIIKCLERGICLFSASEKQWRSSLLSEPPKCKTRTTSAANSSAASGNIEIEIYNDTIDVEIGGGRSTSEEEYSLDFPSGSKYIYTFSEASRLRDAYFMFSVSKFLIADINLKVRHQFRRYFTKLSSSNKISYRKAFRLVDIEIGFLYDVLYTKAPVIKTHWGPILRLISFSCSIGALVGFCSVINKPPFEQVKGSLDVKITFVLILVAICLEIYWCNYHFSSNWTLLWFSRKHEKTFSNNWLFKFVATRKFKRSKKSAPLYMAWHNLISLCFHTTIAKYFRCQPLFQMFHERAGKYLYTTFETVEDDLKNFIFEYIRRQGKEYKASKFCVKVLNKILERRGNDALKSHATRDVCCLHHQDSSCHRCRHHPDLYCSRRDTCLIHGNLCWSTSQVQFDHGILLWHIATDLCYYEELEKTRNQDEDNLSVECRTSKHLSDYMFYLLITLPAMLPGGIGDMRVRYTQNEIVALLETSKVEHECKKVCNKLLEEYGKKEPKQAAYNNKSSLSDGIKLFEKLSSFSSKKWELISAVWIEMLCHAASHCEWEQHARQLERGVEFLTHVSLLMAHLGFSPQIRFDGDDVIVESPQMKQQLSDRDKNVQFILSCLA